MYIICLFPFILIIAPTLGAWIGREFDKEEPPESSAQFIEKYSRVIKMVTAIIVFVMRFFIGRLFPREYNPKRWEFFGIFIGLVVDIPLFLWLLVNASAQ
jgi:hypothetical protein